MCILKIVFGIYTHCQQIDCFLKYSKVNIHFKTQPGPVAKTRLGLKNNVYLSDTRNLPYFKKQSIHFHVCLRALHYCKFIELLADA